MAVLDGCSEWVVARLLSMIARVFWMVSKWMLDCFWPLLGCLGLVVSLIWWLVRLFWMVARVLRMVSRRKLGCSLWLLEYSECFLGRY